MIRQIFLVSLAAVALVSCGGKVITEETKTKVNEFDAQWSAMHESVDMFRNEVDQKTKQITGNIENMNARAAGLSEEIQQQVADGMVAVKEVEKECSEFYARVLEQYNEWTEDFESWTEFKKTSDDGSAKDGEANDEIETRTKKMDEINSSMQSLKEEWEALDSKQMEAFRSIRLLMAGGNQTGIR
jgi:outer membrane murein-binding lipoprotein Lpp